MKNLTIMKNGSDFLAGSSVTDDECKNLSGSIFDMWSAASSLLVDGSKDESPVFEFNEFSFCGGIFDAKWNDDLAGYVIIFNDGSAAHTQEYTESDKLHADFGDTYIERYSEFDSELSEDQAALVDDFVSQVNSLKCTFC
jgi:hypothetical protein